MWRYSMTYFGEQTIGLLDALDIDQAVVWARRRGEHRARGRAAGPRPRPRHGGRDAVLDGAMVACGVAFLPALLATKYGTPAMRVLQRAANVVPRGRCRSSATSCSTPSARTPRRAPPSSRGSSSGASRRRAALRRTMDTKALVIGHPRDPIHPFSDAGMLVDEMPNAQLLEASSLLELRIAPERLTSEIADFIDDCWSEEPAPRAPPPRRASRSTAFTTLSRRCRVARKRRSAAAASARSWRRPASRRPRATSASAWWHRGRRDRRDRRRRPRRRWLSAATTRAAEARPSTEAPKGDAPNLAAAAEAAGCTVTRDRNDGAEHTGEPVKYQRTRPRRATTTRSPPRRASTTRRPTSSSRCTRSSTAASTSSTSPARPRSASSSCAAWSTSRQGHRGLQDALVPEPDRHDPCGRRDGVDAVAHVPGVERPGLRRDPVLPHGLRRQGPRVLPETSRRA